MTSGNPETPSDISLRAAAAYAAALALLLALVFSANVSCLLFGLDGGAWVVGFSAQSARTPFSQVGVDPFQGSFDAYYPAFREYFLPEALALLFTGASASKPLLYTVYGLQLTVSTYLLARAVGVSRSAGLLGGILLAILALPTDLRGGSWVYGIYNMVPHLAQIVSLTSVIIASFWAMDGRRPIIGVALGMIAVASVMIATASFVTMTVLMAPAIAVYAGTCVFSVRERRTAALQIITAGACVAVPAALGMVQYVLVSGGYTAYNFFEAEFMQIRASLTFASVLYHDSSLGGALIGLSLLGAGHALMYGPRKLRVFAATHLIATITFHIGAFLVVRFASGYRGPSPLYFEFMMWPIMLVFVGYLSSVFFGRIIKVASIVTGKCVSGRLANHALICVAPVALGVWGLAAARHPSSCDAVGFSPMRANDITKELERTIAIGPDIAFRGLVATFTGASTGPLDWLALHARDGSVWRATGNDLRLVGLWWYGVPTLFQYSPLMSPQYYLLLTEFLATPADRQARNVLVLSKPDERMLRLWGVRFAISDFDPAIGQSAVDLPIADQPTIRLVELSDVNLGQYSPTDVRSADSFRDVLGLMHDAGFDGARTVITDQSLEGPLVPAEGVQLVFQKHGFSLRATSPGSSVLVLPIQYSHCWTASGAGQPLLFRANGMQLGIRFQRSLAVDLTFRFGPLLASGCRKEDLKDMERLDIRSAREPRRPERPEG